MNKYVVSPDIEGLLSGRAPVPTVVTWNRLEGRPRKRDFSPGSAK